jgi:hypothetical protein
MHVPTGTNYWTQPHQSHSASVRGPGVAGFGEARREAGNHGRRLALSLWQENSPGPSQSGLLPPNEHPRRQSVGPAGERAAGLAVARRSPILSDGCRAPQATPPMWTSGSEPLLPAAALLFRPMADEPSAIRVT